MNRIHWRRGAQELAILPAWPAPAVGWVPVAIASAEHARSLLAEVIDPQQPLRAWLSDEGHGDAHRLADVQVLDLIAARLVQRQLLLCSLARPDAERVMFKMRASSAAPEVAPALSPSSLRPRLAPAEPPPAAPAVVSDFAAMDQNAQAATLKQAAKEGTPFCEACEKLKREREAAAA
jgi:hypothetical protein